MQNIIKTLLFLFTLFMLICSCSTPNHAVIVQSGIQTGVTDDLSWWIKFDSLYPNGFALPKFEINKSRLKPGDWIIENGYCYQYYPIDRLFTEDIDSIK